VAVVADSSGTQEGKRPPGSRCPRTGGTKDQEDSVCYSGLYTVTEICNNKCCKQQVYNKFSVQSKTHIFLSERTQSVSYEGKTTSSFQNLSL
jgi:hypothetical protein